MDGENNGKPLWTNGWFGRTILFGNTYFVHSFGVPVLLKRGPVKSTPTTRGSSECLWHGRWDSYPPPRFPLVIAFLGKSEFRSCREKSWKNHKITCADVFFCFLPLVWTFGPFGECGLWAPQTFRKIKSKAEEWRVLGKGEICKQSRPENSATSINWFGCFTENSGLKPPQIIHGLIGVFHYFHHPFWGFSP